MPDLCTATLKAREGDTPLTGRLAITATMVQTTPIADYPAPHRSTPPDRRTPGRTAPCIGMTTGPRKYALPAPHQLPEANPFILVRTATATMLGTDPHTPGKMPESNLPTANMPIPGRITADRLQLSKPCIAERTVLAKETRGMNSTTARTDLIASTGDGRVSPGNPYLMRVAG